VDAGSCNGCELEIHALNNPYYMLEGLGFRFVASPRHADLLLVTGLVSRHMETALKRTYAAIPEPKLVVAVGNCGRDGGIFGCSYASLGGVSAVIPVDVVVPGCPPSPNALLQGLITAVAVEEESLSAQEKQATGVERPTIGSRERQAAAAHDSLHVAKDIPEPGGAQHIRKETSDE